MADELNFTSTSGWGTPFDAEKPAKEKISAGNEKKDDEGEKTSDTELRVTNADLQVETNVENGIPSDMSNC